MSIKLMGYVGSKAPYANKIKAVFDSNCKYYVETSAGAANVMLSCSKDRYESVVINDANPEIYILFKTLIDSETSNELVCRILNMKLDKNRFEEAKKHRKEILTFPNEYYKNVIDSAEDVYRLYSQSFNSRSKNFNNNIKASYYKRVIQRNIRNVQKRISSNVEVTCKNMLEIVKKYKESDKVQLFCDPPYVKYYRGSKDLYDVEMCELIEHIQFAYELRDAKCAVVLCGYRSQDLNIPTIYDAILNSNEWHCFKIANTYKHCIVVESGECKEESEEYIWTNRIPSGAGLIINLKEYNERLKWNEYKDKVGLALSRMKMELADDKKVNELIGEYENAFMWVHENLDNMEVQ